METILPPTLNASEATQDDKNTSFNSSVYYNIAIATLSLINIIGLLGNFVIVVIIRYKKELHSIPYFQISHLSIASAIFFITSLIFQTINRHYTYQSLANSNQPSVYSNSTATTFNDDNSNSTPLSYMPYCEVCVSILLISTNVLTYILTLISIGHYRAVIALRRRLMTSKKLYKVILFMWIFATCICLPYATLVIGTNVNSTIIICYFRSFTDLKAFIIAYTWFQVMICFILPCIVTCYCYARVICKLHRQYKNRIIKITPNRRMTSQLYHHDRRQRILIRIFSITTLFYIICVSPFSASFLLISFPNQLDTTTDANTQYATIKWMTSILINNSTISLVSQILNVDQDDSRASLSNGIFFALGCICLSILFACMPIIFSHSHGKLRKVMLKIVHFPCRAKRNKKLQVIEFRPN